MLPGFSTGSSRIFALDVKKSPTTSVLCPANHQTCLGVSEFAWHILVLAERTSVSVLQFLDIEYSEETNAKDLHFIKKKTKTNTGQYVLQMQNRLIYKKYILHKMVILTFSLELFHLFYPNCFEHKLSSYILRTRALPSLIKATSC